MANDATSKPRIIVAAVAFDETGESALMEAGRLAAAEPECKLHAVHVLAGGQELSKGALDELRRRVELMWSSYRCDVTVHVRAGRPDQEILRTAADLDADLIVVGTHKRAGLQKLVLGSVAQRLLQEAPCPVLVSVPKSHRSAPFSDRPEAACAACAALRDAADADSQARCEQHSRPHIVQHVYEPTSERRTSILPSF